MVPFHSRFLDVAARETRSIHVLSPGSGLPVGEYSLLEWFCEDPQCECRRVLVQVVPAGHADRVLAVINYGWESVAFYTRWMHGDKKAGREIAGGSLDPLNEQSEHAEELLQFFATSSPRTQNTWRDWPGITSCSRQRSGQRAKKPCLNPSGPKRRTTPAR